VTAVPPSYCVDRPEYGIWSAAAAADKWHYSQKAGMTRTRMCTLATHIVSSELIDLVTDAEQLFSS